jgi:polysaccharide export outer membrane protein
VTQGGEAVLIHSTILSFSMKQFRFVFLVLSGLYLFTSCNYHRQIAYFPDIKDTSIALLNRNFEPVIQKGDILYVGVTSADPISSTLFNSSNVQPSQSSQGSNLMIQNVTTGLLVNSDGTIMVQNLGKILAWGKTKAQLTEEIQQALLPFLKDPVVNIRFMNYRVTVLGEVNRPSTIPISNERVSVLEALGLAGDLTIYGKRDNILYIHENNGQKEFHRINLNDNSLFKSPYFYLQSNDILYVMPNKSKVYSGSQFPILWPAIVNSITLLLLVRNSFIK